MVGVTVDARVVLGGDQHLGDLDGLVVFVVEADLHFAVRPQIRNHARLAHLSQLLSQAVGQLDGQRHQRIGLRAGKTEHHALVAGALVFGAFAVNSLGDVAGLLADAHHHPADIAIKAQIAVVIADVADGLAGQAGNVDPIGLGSDLAGDQAQPGGHQRLAGHPAVRVFGQQGVKDGIGDLVGHLVGVAFGD